MNKALVFVCLIVLLIFAAWFFPVAAWLESVFAWIDTHRSFSWLVFFFVYVLATILMLPGSLITLAAGLLFGLGYGFALVSVASVTGATCAFVIGRFFAREWVEDKLSAMPRFRALDRAIAERGWLIVLLTRLSPVFPFNLLNYSLGLTQVRLPTYMFTSWIGMMPGTLLYVYLGSVASDLTTLIGGEVATTDASSWLLYVGLGATLLLTIVITRIASKALSEQLEAQSKVGDQA